MTVAPGEFEADVLGRPAGWRRVHVVDATVLPSIAATTITFTVMANAHRIATECQQTAGHDKLKVEEIARSLDAWVIRPGLVLATRLAECSAG